MVYYQDRRGAMWNRSNDMLLRRQDLFETHMTWFGYVQNMAIIAIIGVSNRRLKIIIMFGDWSGKTYSTFHYFIT